MKVVGPLKASSGSQTSPLHHSFVKVSHNLWPTFKGRDIVSTSGGMNVRVMLQRRGMQRDRNYYRRFGKQFATLALETFNARIVSPCLLNGVWTYDLQNSLYVSII